MHTQYNVGAVMAKKKSEPPRDAVRREKSKKPEQLSNKAQWLIAFFTIFIALGTAFFLLWSFEPEEAEQTPITSHIIEFYGRECPHCMRMVPVVASAERQLGQNFSKLEVWHNSGNRKVFESYAGAIAPACGGGMGVPAFYNNKTKKAICGEITKESLIEFAQGG
jgi:hypothetical protein